MQRLRMGPFFFSLSLFPFFFAAKQLWALWLLASVEDMIVLSSGREAAKINVYC